MKYSDNPNHIGAWGYGLGPRLLGINQFTAIPKDNWEMPDTTKYRAGDCEVCHSPFSVVKFNSGRKSLMGRRFCMQCGDIKRKKV